VQRERWYRRVVPVTALAVGLVALLAVLVPGVRHQLALSASHQPQQYVELAFGRTAAGTVVTCSGEGDRVRVAFDVTSHLDRARDLGYVLTVAGHRHPGTVPVGPGATAHVIRSVARPTREQYDLRVELPDVDRELLAHCPGTTP
jgi:hypothetical protein